MSYKELRKLYYGDTEEYVAEYERRFSSSDAIQMDFTIAGKQAFFLVNTEVLQLAYNISRIDKKICYLGIDLPGIAKIQYSKKCLIDEIVLTNNIEGVHSSRKEIGAALEILEQQSSERKRYPRFSSMVNKYYKLMANEPVPLKTCQDIRNIYDEVFLEEVVSENANNTPDGKVFRKDIASVYSGTGKMIHQGLMPEAAILEAMEKALNFLNNESIEKLYRICLFHYLLEYIHPFYDGNGRLGRFILSYCISKELEPLLAYRISETIKENISAYYKAFETCNDPHNLGDLTPFLIMQLNMIYLASKTLQESLERRQISWNKYQHLACSLPNADNSDVSCMYNLLIQAALFSESGISTAQLCEQFDVTYNTIRRLLDKLPRELLVCAKKGKTKYYQINLQVLDELMLKK